MKRTVHRKSYNLQIKVSIKKEHFSVPLTVMCGQDGNGYLSTSELKFVMTRLNVHFTDTVRGILHKIVMDGGGLYVCTVFFLFCRPSKGSLRPGIVQMAPPGKL
jgi:hypothetical protein